jgi:peptidoglycan/LPS O-acetylase OafA/YrhL
MNTPSKACIKPLTSLRFFAAFLVFLFHFHIHYFPLFGIPNVDFIISRGAIGMSLFFILSGFVLQYNYGDLSIYKEPAAKAGE